MEKLLHERLMGCQSLVIANDILGINTIKIADTFSTIADEIERYYIPRPRFEDGTPVQFGDEVELHYKSGGCEKGRIQAFHANRGPVWILSFVGCDHEHLYRYDSEADVLKRPAPKVLDADGVPIKAGENVWCTTTGNPCRIIRVDPSTNMCAVEWTDSVHLDSYLKAGCITHKEPDSLEKLRDDLMAAHENWEGDPNDLVGYADRLTALIERGA